MAGHLVLTGRSKDTIVLSNGENIEPAPLEDAICASPLIKFATLVGGDHRVLGALVVVDQEALDDLASTSGALSDDELRSKVCFQLQVLCWFPGKCFVGSLASVI